MKPISAGSMDGRVLLALRAGPTTTSELAERFGYKMPLGQLVRAGLIVCTDDTYNLTDAGRAACPFRNPLAAKPATLPEVFTMPKGETKLTRQQVLAAIVEAGPSGATRKELIDKFAHLVVPSAVENHFNALLNETQPRVFKPRPGLLVDIKFRKADAAPEIAHETASTATDVLPVSEFVQIEHLELEAIQNKLDNALTVLSLVTGLKDAAEARVKELESRPESYPVDALDVEQITARPVVFDTDLEDPDQVEFCIYSSGGLDMLTEQGTIRLYSPVLNKLRAFLGLFAEAA